MLGRCLKLALARGVYGGMFEQSFLPETPRGKAAGAFFATLSAQIAGIGVLILLPLYFNERLPSVHMSFALPVRLSQPPQPEVVETNAARAPAPSTTARTIFRLPSLRSTAPAAA